LESRNRGGELVHTGEVHTPRNASWVGRSPGKGLAV
jgi:hypothetical protein